MIEADRFSREAATLRSHRVQTKVTRSSDCRRAKSPLPRTVRLNAEKTGQRGRGLGRGGRIDRFFDFPLTPTLSPEAVLNTFSLPQFGGEGALLPLGMGKPKGIESRFAEPSCADQARSYVLSLLRDLERCHLLRRTEHSTSSGTLPDESVSLFDRRTPAAKEFSASIRRVEYHGTRLAGVPTHSGNVTVPNHPVERLLSARR